jgi:mRNA-degrading endonuclease RelE of RelBE toxin-antitoxin system
MAFRIEYSPAVVGHLRALSASDRVRALAGIDRHLRHEPFVETRNRKRMRPNPVAPWELRLGDLRVYFDIEVEREPLVVVLAIGKKIRDRVVIGRMEIEL